MAFLDTNVVVRYLTGDPPHLADRAARIIDGSRDLLVTGVVIAEAAYVLTGVYRVPRGIVVDHLVAFLRRQNVRPYALDRDAVISGLLLCRPSGRVSFADAMVWAAARSTRDRVVYTLDENFPSDGVEVRHEP